MGKVREKREFALSLGEFLAAPSEASTTRMMMAPGMRVETPIGLEKLERAFVQADLIADQKKSMLERVYTSMFILLILEGMRRFWSGRKESFQPDSMS